MLRRISPRGCLFPASLFVKGPAVHAEDSAPFYYLAILEFGPPLKVPHFVDSATSDDPEHGFSVPLTATQASFLRETPILSALSRFEDATSCNDCNWRRYTSSAWSDAELNNRLHRLARIALLRARLHYERGEWINGNRDVERVRIMARHMTLQARPWEHQCFMIENMATGTAAAYLLRLPPEALADLLDRHRRVGTFSPMSRMIAAEAERIDSIAGDYETGRIAPDAMLSFIDPLFGTDDDAAALTRASRKESARQLSNLSKIMDELSHFMNKRDLGTETELTELWNRFAPNNPLVAGLEGWPVEEFRENAQGICRGLIFGEVVDRLQNGIGDFANISDPYGDSVLTLHETPTSFTLVSQLVHHSQVHFMFGLAGSGMPTNQPMQPSGDVGRCKLDDQSSPPVDR
jgi:hypothetical protein